MRRSFFGVNLDELAVGRRAAAEFAVVGAGEVLAAGEAEFEREFGDAAQALGQSFPRQSQPVLE
jgi:hypothetical protein